MNSEIIKAMSKKKKTHPIRKWWSKNGYKVLRIIFFPIWIILIIHEKIINWLMLLGQGHNCRQQLQI